MKKLRRLLISLGILLIILFPSVLVGQSRSDVLQFEELYKHWCSGLENARKALHVNEEDFLTFRRFFEKQIDSLRPGFMQGINFSNADEKERKLCLQAIALYKRFQVLEKEYPSSVEPYQAASPYRLMSACDSSGCTNIDFEQGSLNGWNAYYGYNDNNGTYTYFNITNITGGAVGALTEAANDTLTSTAGYYNAAIGPNPVPDYEVSITSGTRGDALVPSVPAVSPFGGKYSAMLGDSTMLNHGVAILSKTFLVNTSNADFTYQYAVFLENPPSHSYFEQPFFQVALLDQNGDTIPYCGQYAVVSSGGATSGFSSVYVPPNGNVGNDTAYYKDWTIVSVPLKKYIGQCVTIVFESGDCSLGGHFGYAYVDASCSPLQILTSSPALCGQKYITLTGPPGFIHYYWSSNTGLSMTGDTTQVIKVDSAGTYQLIAVPVTGTSCADTLSITISKLPGPPPLPSFSADTTCLGLSTSFMNTSTPLAGAGVKFYWDFYSLGTFQDSAVNPSWTFNLPGTYYVKLYETINGCGADTTIEVVVTPPPVASITAPNSTCEGDPVKLIASGGGTYLWNTGATTSSITVSPGIADTLFLVRVTNGCSDTATHSLKVIPVFPIKACCDTAIYYGQSATISVSSAGTFSYIWSPNVACDTCAVTMASPLSNTTYTVMGSVKNGCISTDTVTIDVITCDNAWIPDAFTPNHDKLNDVFEPKGKCILSYIMYVFDRWGAIIYQGNKPWDGTVKGNKVQEDTYIYKMVITTSDQQQKTYLGTVTVIR